MRLLSSSVRVLNFNRENLRMGQTVTESLKQYKGATPRTGAVTAGSSSCPSGITGRVWGSHDLEAGRRVPCTVC